MDQQSWIAMMHFKKCQWQNGLLKPALDSQFGSKCYLVFRAFNCVRALRNAGCLKFGLLRKKHLKTMHFHSRMPCISMIDFMHFMHHAFHAWRHCSLLLKHEWRQAATGAGGLCVFEDWILFGVFALNKGAGRAKKKGPWAGRVFLNLPEFTWVQISLALGPARLEQDQRKGLDPAVRLSRKHQQVIRLHLQLSLPSGQGQ